MVGVLVASSKRRGQVMTTAQSSIHELLAQFPAVHDAVARGTLGAPAGHIDGNSFTTHGQALRHDLAVAKVLCEVRQPRRRP